MSEFIDDDGYPTDAGLAWIRNYSGSALEFFRKLKSMWYLDSWGFSESIGYRCLFRRKRIVRFEISTAGWSGNEEIISTMRKHYHLWSTCWVQERVGGHFIFEVNPSQTIMRLKWLS